MSWTLKITDKETFDDFNQLIEDNSFILRNKRIFIWGASVCGTLMGILLERRGLNDFIYIDNDERKWGQNINGYQIIGPNYKLLRANDSVVIISIKHNKELCDELKNKGIKNLIYPCQDDEIDFAQRTIKCLNRSDFSIIFGDGILDNIVIEDKNDIPLKDLLLNKLGQNKLMTLSINCIGMELIYNIVRIILNYGRPSSIIILLELETFTEAHYRLSRTQHISAISYIKEHIPTDKAFNHYYNKSMQYSKNYRDELKYSPRRSYDKIEYEQDIQREYLDKYLLNRIDKKFEEIKYLEKTLSMCKDNSVKTLMIQMPINFELDNILVPGADIFLKKNLEIFREIAKEYGGSYIDLSQSLNKDDFITGVTTQDSISKGGKLKLCAHILKLLQEI